MNKYFESLLDKPSLVQDTCVFCGRLATEKHHIVPRSQGGTKGPVMSVCGLGNTNGCHGLLHAHRLHVRWNDGWEYLITRIATKYENALKSTEWKKL